MIPLFIVSFIVFALYIIGILATFGIPHSISDSFYLMEEKRNNLGYLFTLWCFFIAFSLIPVIFHLTEGEWFQFLGLFTCGGLGFVGAAPFFRGYEKTIHFTGAIVCAVTGFSWMVLSGYWRFPVVALLAALYPAYKDKKWTFWGESALFLSMYATLSVMLL
ncbi:MAG: hypothetical protein LBU37_02265 [Tannerellaceae bacterium]|jgi:hypothetical protein|nr:hypothetical protein [Tannerellaceae bacterium]